MTRAKSTTIKKETAELKIATTPKTEKSTQTNKTKTAGKKELSSKVTELRRVPLDTLVPVSSNCSNPLIYVSKRQNGYKVEWENYGDVDYMQVSELIAMRGSDRKFFINNWIVIKDDVYTADEVYNTIGVSKLYENVVTPETIVDLLEKPIPQIRAIMGKMSNGLKRTVYHYTLQLKSDGKFDSIKKFEAIKEIAGVSDFD